MVLLQVQSSKRGSSEQVATAKKGEMPSIGEHGRSSLALPVEQNSRICVLVQLAFPVAL